MVQRMAALGLAWLCILAAVAGCSRPAEQDGCHNRKERNPDMLQEKPCKKVMSVN